MVYVPYGDTTGYVEIIACDFEGCDTCIVYIRNTFDIAEEPFIPNDYAIKAYPNPFNSSINISIPDGFTGAILDVHGNKICDIQSSVFNWQPESNIESGVYIIECSKENLRFVKRIVYSK